MKIDRLLLSFLLVLSLACAGEKQTEPVSSESTDSRAVSQPSTTASSGEFDLQFIDAMRQHHQAAVEMARSASGKASDVKIRSMAARMAADQEKEITQLSAWREQWFPGASPADVSKLPGASSMNMDMSHMQSLSGHQFDMMFVDMMIPHHEGAVTMSCEAHNRSGRQELKTFARDVIRKQETEISELTAWKQSKKM